MVSDTWFDSYTRGDFLPEPATTTAVTDAVADPLLVVGTVIDLLAARGVPVVLDHSLERAAEAAGHLLRHLGVAVTA